MLDGLIARGAIGLPLVCQGLNERAATELRDPLLAAHEAVGPHAQTKDSDEQLAWAQGAGCPDALGELPTCCCAGCVPACCWTAAVARRRGATQLSRQLSSGTTAGCGAWLDGFLNRNAMVLLRHDETGRPGWRA